MASQTDGSDDRAETERVRAIWDRLAARYDRGTRFEGLLIGDGRRWATSQASGDTLEIGIGSGRNLDLYAPEVRLVGIDVSTGMLGIARARPEAAGRELRVGDAQRLDFPDAAFDTVVSTFVLCSVPDDRAAIAEAYRVLRPGGRFVIIEHVRSHLAPIRAIERAFEAGSVRSSGDHLLRDPLDHLVAIGFEIMSTSRHRLGFIERTIAVRPS
jgi:ubiquinone/menaquinone biosynthesis C-methylase UbiE